MSLGAEDKVWGGDRLGHSLLRADLLQFGADS